MPWNVCYNNHFTKDNYQTSRAHPLSSGCCCRYLYTCVSHESAQFHLQDKLMPPTSVSHNFADVFVAIYRCALLKILVIGGQTLASIFPSSNWQQITLYLCNSQLRSHWNAFHILWIVVPQNFCPTETLAIQNIAHLSVVTRKLFNSE